MRILNSPLPFVFLLVILTLGQISSSRFFIHGATKEKADPRSRTQASTPFSWRFSAVPPSPNPSRSNTDPVFGVSGRAVPGGPNPLHN
uniref:Uncharacterized protein n=1 Tax=Nelumbo nucifera TaxID=4432 RepID=A0A822XIH0_NELNU|nr:TPA_asm: hypothetical protein HUJ06_020302 [Nelumbo nucifera]